MIISKSKNFTYIHIEKCSGTSIEVALTPYLNKNDIIFGGNFSYFKTFEKKLLWKHSDSNDIKTYLGLEWDNMYKFATVRNPKEIMISFYFYIRDNIINFLPDKITEVHYDTNFPDEIKNDGSIVYTDDLRDLYFIQSEIDGSGIDGFIYRMITNNLKEVAPQLTKIDESVEVFDISTINKYWSQILNKLNIYDEVKLPIINKSNRPESIILKKSTLELIYNHFSIDYLKIPLLTKTNWQ